MDKKVVEYIVVVECKLVDAKNDAETVQPINTKVNSLIKDGWQPLGGVAPLGMLHFQAMVKYS